MSALTPSSAEVTAPVSRPQDRLDLPRYYGLSAATWLQIAILTVLFGLLYWPNLTRLWSKTNPIYGEANWGHAIVVPVVGLYYLYVNWDELRRKRVEPLRITAWTRNRLISSACFVGAGLLISLFGPLMLPALGDRLISPGLAVAAWGLLAAGLNWGVGTLVFGIAFFGYGIWPGQNDYIKDLGMVISLFGLVLALCGWEVMKIAWFPIVFLICALPWPGLVYSWVAGPLQEIAARVAVEVLQVTGVDARVMGTKIFMIGEGDQPRTLNVAEACAGLKSLMTFVTIGAAMAFLSSRPMWQKLFITFSAVPIAIFCNTMRVAGQGLLDRYWSQEWSQGFAHQFAGMIMLIPAFFLLLLVQWILDQLFIEEVDDQKGTVAKTTVVAPARAAEASQPAAATPPPAGGSAAARKRPVIVAPPPPAGGSLRPKARPQE